MKERIAATSVRLARPEATPAQRHVHAGIITALLVATAALGLVVMPLLYIAAGAGAGYSLSGSV